MLEALNRYRRSIIRIRMTTTHINIIRPGGAEIKQTDSGIQLHNNVANLTYYTLNRTHKDTQLPSSNLSCNRDIRDVKNVCSNHNL
jgi:hypothetical protein